jgi:hypothetical protein
MLLLVWECEGLHPFTKLEYRTGHVLQADGVTGGECGGLHPFTKLEYRTGLVSQADGVRCYRLGVRVGDSTPL